MSFGDDACRIRKDKAPLAIATLRHVALHCLHAAKQKRESVKRLRKKTRVANLTREQYNGLPFAFLWVQKGT